jgi:hypothetical protein
MRGVRKYGWRVLLFIVLVVFTGCCDEDCASAPEPKYCGKPLETSGEAVLTPDSPTLRIVSDTGVLECGAICYLNCRWSSLGANERPDNLDSSNVPTITVKFGTVEGGVAADVKPARNPDIYGMWQSSFQFPKKEPKGVTKQVHYVITATLKQPIIKVPGKGPTIALPFLGTLIGPKPNPVYVNGKIMYSGVP